MIDATPRRAASLVTTAILTVCIATTSFTQTPVPADAKAAYDAHSKEFDYLLGEWRFDGSRTTAAGMQTFHGTWKATRSDEGALVTDEYRVLDDGGRTLHVTVSVRAFSPLEGHWNVISVEPSVGLIQSGTAVRDDREMVITQTYHNTNGTSALMHFHYFNISPDHFSWRGDASTDGGVTWHRNFQTIEAYRKGTGDRPSHPPPGSS